MRPISIQMTYRKGKPFAAYIDLGRRSGEPSVRSHSVTPEIIADFASDDRVLGLEIISPDSVTAEQILDAFDQLGLGRPTVDELAPLVAA